MLPASIPVRKGYTRCVDVVEREQAAMDDALALAARLSAVRAAGDAEQMESLLLRLGAARLTIGDVAGALAAFSEAAPVAEGRGEPPVAAAVGAAEAALAGGDRVAMSHWIQRVADHLGGESDEGVRARGVALTLLSAADESGTFDGAAWARASQALEHHGAAGSRWRLWMGWASALERHGLEPDALDVYTEVADAARLAGRRHELGPARAAAARLLVDVGRLAEADIALEEAVAVAGELGDAAGLESCLAMASDLAIHMGQPRLVALRLHDRAELAALRGDGAGRARLLVQALRGAVRGEIRDLAFELAGEVLDAALSVAPDVLPPALLDEIADDVEATGREEEARDLLLHATRMAFAAGDPRGAVRSLVRAARLTAAVGDRDHAREMWDEAVAVAVQHRLDDAASWAAERDRFFAPAGA